MGLCWAKRVVRCHWVSLCVLVLLGAWTRADDSNAYPPKGIFACYGFSLNDRVLQAPYLSGVLIRARWRDVEPHEGRYDWSYLQREIGKAKRYGKKVTLALVGGPHTPDWVYVAGAADFEYIFNNPYSPRGGRTERIPLPWDALFLQKWTRTIHAFGSRFRSDRDVVLVHMTGSSKNGFELQLPERRRRGGAFRGLVDEEWLQAGYTEAKLLAAWKGIIDAFAEAFPNKALDLEIHPLLGNNAIPAQLAEYAHHKMGRRFGTFGGWLSGRPPAWDTEMRRIMGEHCRRSFCGYQLIANETRQAQRLGPGGLIGAIRTGMDEGARYFEVWEADVKNRAFDQPLLGVSREIAP